MTSKKCGSQIHQAHHLGRVSKDLTESPPYLIGQYVPVGTFYRTVQPVKPTPNWYQDPKNPSQLRWWDGSKWTRRTRAILPAEEKPAPGPATAEAPVVKPHVTFEPVAPPPPPPTSMHGSTIESPNGSPGTASTSVSKKRVLSGVATAVGILVGIGVVSASEISTPAITTEVPVPTFQVPVSKEPTQTLSLIDLPPVAADQTYTPYSLKSMWSVEEDPTEQLRRYLALPSMAPGIPPGAVFDSGAFSHEITRFDGYENTTTEWTLRFNMPGSIEVEGETYIRSLAATDLGSPSSSETWDDGSKVLTFSFGCVPSECVASNPYAIPPSARWTVRMARSFEGNGMRVIVTGTYVNMVRVTELMGAVQGSAWLRDAGIPASERLTKVNVTVLGNGEREISTETAFTTERGASEHSKAKEKLLGGQSFLGTLKSSYQPDLGDSSDEWEQFFVTPSTGMLKDLEVVASVYRPEPSGFFLTEYQVLVP